MTILNVKDALRSQKDVIQGLIYINYAYNRDLGMDHGSIIKLLDLIPETANTFKTEYEKRKT